MVVHHSVKWNQPKQPSSLKRIILRGVVWAGILTLLPYTVNGSVKPPLFEEQKIEASAVPGSKNKEERQEKPKSRPIFAATEEDIDPKKRFQEGKPLRPNEGNGGHDQGGNDTAPKPTLGFRARGP